MTKNKLATAKSPARSPRRYLSAALLVVPCWLFLLAACSDSPSEPRCEPIPRTVEGDVTPPVRVFAPQPQYTEAARRARIQGVVILQTIIDCEGIVVNVTVLKGLSHGLTEAAVDAISRWRFEPATLNGRPVTVFYNFTINFRLQDPEPADP